MIYSFNKEQVQVKRATVNNILYEHCIIILNPAIAVTPTAGRYKHERKKNASLTADYAMGVGV